MKFLVIDQKDELQNVYEEFLLALVPSKVINEIQKIILTPADLR